MKPGGKTKRDGILCPECKCGTTFVTCTTIVRHIARRKLPDGIQGIARRRQCTSCSLRFSTLELPIELMEPQ